MCLILNCIIRIIRRYKNFFLCIRMRSALCSKSNYLLYTVYMQKIPNNKEEIFQNFIKICVLIVSQLVLSEFL